MYIFNVPPVNVSWAAKYRLSKSSCPNLSNCCTQCSGQIFPTTAITLKWHHSFQALLLEQQPGWIDGTSLAAWSSLTPDRERVALSSTCLSEQAAGMRLCMFNLSFVLLLLFVFCIHIYLFMLPPFAFICTDTNKKKNLNGQRISIQKFVFLFAMSEVQKKRC